jgi:hypothetical protein
VLLTWLYVTGVMLLLGAEKWQRFALMSCHVEINGQISPRAILQTPRIDPFDEVYRQSP